MVSVGQPWMWAGFIVFVLAMLTLDLFVLGGRNAHKVSAKEAASWSVVWLSLALAFNGLLWWYLTGLLGTDVANQKSMEFLTGYVIEKSLSVDNVFVFLLIFGAFKVTPENQRRVLLYGVLGAIVLRAIMILAGAWVVREFQWILYLFGIFLLVTGVRMLLVEDKPTDLQQNSVIKFAKRHLRITDNFHGEKFSVRLNDIRYFTPLFLVLLMIEISDLIFAVDSIPAIFAITTASLAHLKLKAYITINSKPESMLGKLSLSTSKCSTIVSGGMQKLAIKYQLTSPISITLITQLQHNHHDLPFY